MHSCPFFVVALVPFTSTPCGVAWLKFAGEYIARAFFHPVSHDTRRVPFQKPSECLFYYIDITRILKKADETSVVSIWPPLLVVCLFFNNSKYVLNRLIQGGGGERLRARSFHRTANVYNVISFRALWQRFFFSGRYELRILRDVWSLFGRVWFEGKKKIDPPRGSILVKPKNFQRYHSILRSFRSPKRHLRHVAEEFPIDEYLIETDPAEHEIFTGKIAVDQRGAHARIIYIVAWN